jgi:glucose-1-phosphate thymidylyltransferase
LLEIEVLERGMGWMDAGTIDSLYGAGEMVRVLQERQGLRIGVPEEVGLRNGWLSASNLADAITEMPQTEYSRYLKKIVEDFI